MTKKLAVQEVLERELDSHSESWNYGWADCINKELLAKPKFTKNSAERKNKVSYNVGTKSEEVNMLKGESKPKTIEMKHNILRIKPSAQDVGTQKALKKIATKGVVHFFNAVKTQQKKIEEKTKNERTFQEKEDFMLKNIDKTTFLDILLGTPKSDVDSFSK